MVEWLLTLKSRNEVLCWFGLLNFFLAFVFLLLSRIAPAELSGANVWYKPVKFGLSIGILVWTMAWISAWLPQNKALSMYNWAMVATLGFEILYIGWQASRGLPSHFYVPTPLYTALYALMGFAAFAATLATLLVSLPLFTSPPPHLPLHFVWALRLGLILFVVFALEGFLMGARMGHSVPGPDGGKGIPFLQWSFSQGDLRAAHFVGMHALQLLPLLAWYLIQDLRGVFVLAGLYALLAAFILWCSLSGKPFWSF